MGKTVFVRDLVDGQQVEEVFLVTSLKRADTRQGRPYLALTLMDRSGEVNCRVWDRVEELAPVLAEGHHVLVQAQASTYNNVLQLTIRKARPAAEHEVDPADFLPVSPRDLDAMLQELEQNVRSIGHPGLRGLTRKLVLKGDTGRRFAQAPAAKRMHHACLHGLLEHSLSVASLVRMLAAHYPGTDQDLLLAGALLHDLGKIDEFSYDRPPFDYTDQGRLVGHIVLGVDMVRRTGAGMRKTLEPPVLTALCHLILSHHGRMEHGSPCLPMTPEAFLLHAADELDSKMEYIRALARDMEGDGPAWTPWQRPLERFLYLSPLRGDEEGNRPGPASPERGSRRDGPPEEGEGGAGDPQLGLPF